MSPEDHDQEQTSILAEWAWQEEYVREEEKEEEEEEEEEEDVNKYIAR